MPDWETLRGSLDAYTPVFQIYADIEFRIELQLEFTSCHVTPQKPLFTRPVLQILLKRNLRKQLTFCDATTRSHPSGGVTKC